MVGGFQGMLLLSAKHTRSPVWWEDTLWKAVRDAFWRTVENHPISAKDIGRLHQFGPKVLPGIFLGNALHAGGIWKRRHLGRRHGGMGTDGRIWNLSEKTQSKGSVIAHEKWQHCCSQSRMEQWNFLGECQVLRTSALIRDRPNRGEDQGYLQTCHGRDHFVKNFHVDDTTSLLSASILNLNLPWDNNVADCALFTRTGLQPYWASFWVIFNICDAEAGRFNVWNQTFTDGDPRKTAVFHSFFPHVLEIAQSDCTRRDSSALGIIRTLSRIDRIFINLPMAEVWDFHCYSHVSENLGNRTIPSDHAAVRLLIHKPTTWEQSCKRIPSWMSKTYRFLFPFAAASRRPQVLSWSVLCTRRVQSYSWTRLRSRRFVNSHGRHLAASEQNFSSSLLASRAYRNRHLGTLMRCCEAWKPIENCFDPIFFWTFWLPEA